MGRCSIHFPLSLCQTCGFIRGNQGWPACKMALLIKKTQEQLFSLVVLWKWKGKKKWDLIQHWNVLDCLVCHSSQLIFADLQRLFPLQFRSICLLRRLPRIKESNWVDCKAILVDAMQNDDVEEQTGNGLWQLRLGLASLRVNALLYVWRMGKRLLIIWEIIFFTRCVSSQGTPWQMINPFQCVKDCAERCVTPTVHCAIKS